MGYMAATVHPRMREVFVAEDAKYAKSFGCQTCHGEDADRVDFRMPAQLYALPAAGPVAAAMEVDEDVASFMMGKVVPAMAELLAEKAGAGGVNCFTCHPKE